MTKLWLTASFLVLFLLPLGLIIRYTDDSLVSKPGTKPEMAADPPQIQTTPQSTPPTPVQTPASESASSRLLIGDPNASVTLIEYGDFQCPFCAQFYRQTEPSIIRDYVDTGRVNIEFRVETHIGNESAAAGEAAYCANDQGGFKAYHDALFERQNGENNGAFSNVNLEKIAADIGLEASAFASCLDSGAYSARVKSSHAEARQRGVTSTPTIYIGGNKVSGAQPYAIYKQLLDAELQ